MNRIPQTAPEIAALDNGIARVSWSVMIPVFNCSQYLPEALESVLMQDMGTEHMQIEVVDDWSTDINVEELVQRIGKGRVGYFKQKENVGSLRNFETCINRSRGNYIHLLHGDDKVKPGFYEIMKSLFDMFPEAGAAFCAWDHINERSEIIKTSKTYCENEGIFENCLKTLLREQVTQYASTVVQRRIYEKLGGFYGVKYGEDWIMWARIAQSYPVVYTPKVLAEYREHSTSISGLSFLNGDNFRDVNTVSQIISSCLTAKQRTETKNVIRRNYTLWMLGRSYEVWEESRNNGIFFRQLKYLLYGHLDFKILIIIAKFWLIALAYPLKRRLNF